MTITNGSFFAVQFQEDEFRPIFGDDATVSTTDLYLSDMVLCAGNSDYPTCFPFAASHVVVDEEDEITHGHVNLCLFPL